MSIVKLFATIFLLSSCHWILAQTDTFIRAEAKLLSGNLLDKSDSVGISFDEAEKLRNTVFARYGRTFKRKDLQSYFEKKFWYKARKEYADNLLTPNDKANIEFLKGLEENILSQPAENIDFAMKKFIASVRRKDTKRFLSLISQQNSCKLVNNIAKPPIVEAFTHNSLEKDFAQKGSLYNFFFEPLEELDDFTDYFTDGGTWKRSGTNTFSPESFEGVKVLWQKEGRIWVIKEIEHISS
ncbi:MAG: YARHG domain-containing protein [Blastocatellia bacterium]|nr:YARHG domain-containing protein [Blastocatellia bacterium]